MPEKTSVAHLLSLIPHSNVERAVGRLQERIYSNFGLASAMALPPMIPLRFLQPGAEALVDDSNAKADSSATADSAGVEVSDAVHDSIRGLDDLVSRVAGLKARPTGLLTVAGALYLGVELTIPGRSISTAELLRPARRESGRSSAAPLFPLAGGFYLCMREAESADGAAPSGRGEVDPLKGVSETESFEEIPASHLRGFAVFRIEFLSRKRWWDGTYWEMTALIKLRKGRD